MPGKKRTYEPHTRRRKSVHGFRRQMEDANGRKVLASRKAKGRHKLQLGSNNLYLTFDLRIFTPEKIVETISLLSEIYSSIGGDQLIISDCEFLQLKNNKIPILV